jgi:hypothetical protein
MSVFLRGRSVKLRHRPQNKTRAQSSCLSGFHRLHDRDSSSDMNLPISIEA